jgi:uncharacterized protein YbjT (DUF2867 family)
LHPKIILVTGATGYIASGLIPQLLERGYAVHALARSPQRLQSRSWFNKIDIFHGDVMEPASLAPSLTGVHTAYYLVHNMSLGSGYTKLEMQAAHNFVVAAEAAGVQHIIYLGGLADHNKPISQHLLSRIETGAALSQGRIPVTEFRASVIIGSGSISFEMIRFIAELFPIIPIPVWMKNRSQPIAIQNIMDYLLAALEKFDGNQVFEIGGQEIITYQNVMLRYAHIRGHKRSFFLLPYIPVEFMAFGIGLVTPVPRLVARALVGGLSHDSVVANSNVHEIYPEVNLLGFESATKEALDRLHPLKIERVWNEGKGHAKILRHEGFFIDHRETKAAAAPQKIFNAITKFAERFRTQQFVVDAADPDHFLLLRSTIKIPGAGWLEWRVDQTANVTRLHQTVFFAPHGMTGFLFWYLSYLFRAALFHQLIKNVARHSVVE